MVLVESFVLGVAGGFLVDAVEHLLTRTRTRLNDQFVQDLGEAIRRQGIGIDEEECSRLAEWIRTTGIVEQCRSLLVGDPDTALADQIADSIAYEVLLTHDYKQCPDDMTLTVWADCSHKRAARISGILWDALLVALPPDERLSVLGLIAASATISEQGETARLAAEVERLAERLDSGLPFERWRQKPAKGMSAADLLTGDHRLVPYVDREGLLDQLVAWCEDGRAGAVAARILYGAGGSGKTRLAVELCQRMQLRGWRAGLYSHPATGQVGQLESLARASEPRLIAVDYADTKTGEIEELLSVIQSQHQRKANPIRLLLIIRRSHTDDDPRRFLVASKLASELVHRSDSVVRLSKERAAEGVAFGAEERSALYRSASQAFAHRLTPQPEAADPPRDLDKPTWALPLAVTMRALLDLDPGEADPAAHTATDQVIEQVLRREERLWGNADCPIKDSELRRQAVGLATLFAPPSPDDARHILALVFDDNLDEIGLWLSRLHHGPHWCSPLAPDLLGEHLINETISSAWIELALEADRTAADPYALETLVRVTAAHNRTRRLIAAPFFSSLERLMGRLARTLTPEAMRAGTAAARLLQLLEPAFDQLPASPPQDYGPALDLLLMEMEGSRVQAIRLRQGGGADDHHADLGAALSVWSHLLLRVGRFPEALEAAQEAVDVFRRLAAEEPATFQADLVQGLNNLCNARFQSDDSEGGLQAIDEAVAIIRSRTSRSEEGKPEDLAAALSNRAGLLASIGRTSESIESSTEAVSLYRVLAAEDPATYEPLLSAALTNHAGQLHRMNRFADGVQYATEAVTIRRRLASTNPAGFQEPLAVSLQALSRLLRDTGYLTEGIAAIEEVVATRRTVAARGDAVADAALADSLTAMASLLTRKGSLEASSRALQEAISVRRRLAEAQPATYEGTLAAALTQYSDVLRGQGEVKRALVAIQEAIGIRRALAVQQPRGLSPGLANALTASGEILRRTGPLEEARDALEEAVEIYRQLAAYEAQVYEPGYASSLVGYSNLLSSLHRPHESLAQIERALEIYDRLADQDPGSFEAELAGSLDNWARVLVAVGRPRDGIGAALSAVDIYRKLSDANSGAYKTDLVMALEHASQLLAGIGALAEATDAIVEAVETCREILIEDMAHKDDFLGRLLTQQAHLWNKVGQSDDARSSAEQAIALYRRQEERGDVYDSRWRGQALGTYAQILSESQRSDDAFTAIHEAVSLTRQLEREGLEVRVELAKHLSNMSTILLETGSLAESAAASTECLQIYGELVEEGESEASKNLAIVLAARSKILRQQGNLVGAASAIREAADRMRVLADQDFVSHGPMLARMLEEAAEASFDTGHSVQGLECQQEAIEVYGRLAKLNPEGFSEHHSAAIAELRHRATSDNDQ
ncbi:MAG: tetratricopeptide repeat protein [Microthrixaceae bacterium]|nr:tetratricopeptide repeat protein [Microthrixaceae bacterium]